MEYLEAKFGVTLNSNYAYSPFSLVGIKAWRPVYVYGLDVSYSDDPMVKYALWQEGKRVYSEVRLSEFKKTFQIVVSDVSPKRSPPIRLARCG